MKFQDKQVLLFDLDGTLVDSAPDLALAINQMLTELGRATFSEHCIRGWVGNGAEVLVKRALSGSGSVSAELNADDVAIALAIFLASYQANVCVATTLYDGVKQTLVALKQQGFKLAIVTNKPEVFVAPILEQLELDGLFELILGGDTLPRRKPDPLPLVHAVKYFGVTNDHCLMIGDSKNDILAAKAANIDSVGLTYGYNYGEDIAIHQPELVLHKFAGLTQALG